MIERAEPTQDEKSRSAMPRGTAVEVPATGGVMLRVDPSARNAGSLRARAGTTDNGAGQHVSGAGGVMASSP